MYARAQYLVLQLPSFPVPILCAGQAAPPLLHVDFVDRRCVCVLFLLIPGATCYQCCYYDAWEFGVGAQQTIRSACVHLHLLVPL